MCLLLVTGTVAFLRCPLGLSGFGQGVALATPGYGVDSLSVLGPISRSRVAGLTTIGRHLLESKEVGSYAPGYGGEFLDLDWKESIGRPGRLFVSSIYLCKYS